MSCGGSITIFGLFPETDTPPDEVDKTGCDWSIYARPECSATSYDRLPNALEFRSYTAIPIPFSSLITDPTKDIKITFDFYPTLKSIGYTYSILEGPATTTVQPDRLHISYVHRNSSGGNYLYREFLGEYSSGSSPVQTRYDNQNYLRWFTMEYTINNTDGTKDLRTLDRFGHIVTYNDSTITSAQIKELVYPTSLYPGGKERDNGFHPILIANVKIWQGTELLGYWPIDEGTGNIFFDRSGNGNHVVGDLGSISGGAVWVDAPYFGNINRCFNSTGDSEILIPLAGATPGTYGYIVDLITKSTSTDQTILLNTFGTTPGDSNHLLVSRNYSPTTYSNGHLEIGTYSDDNLGTSANYPRPDNWIRDYISFSSSVSLTHASADEQAGFSNSSYAHTGYSIDFGAWTQTQYLQIGKGLVGKLRDVFVYDGNNVYPYAWYPMDDGPDHAGILTDRSGNGNHGLLNPGTGTWTTVW